MDSAQMWTRYKEQGDLAAREEIILHYAFLVRCVADRLGIHGSAELDRDGLISHGIIGLIDAVEKYDHSRGPRFESYAGAHIRAAILGAVQCADSLPRSVRVAADRIERAVVELERSLGRHPTLGEVSALSGLSEEEIEKVLARVDGAPERPLGAPDLAADAGPVLGNLALMALPGEEETPWASQETDAEAAEQRRILIQAIGSLPADERLVLSLYYVEELTLKEIAQVVSLPDERVTQIHTRAMMRLRAHLRTQADLFAAA